MLQNQSWKVLRNLVLRWSLLLGHSKSVLEMRGSAWGAEATPRGTRNHVRWRDSRRPTFFFFLINLPKERRVSKYFHHMEGKR